MGIDCISSGQLPEKITQSWTSGSFPVVMIEKKGIDTIIISPFATKARIDDRARDSIDLTDPQNIADCACGTECATSSSRAAEGYTDRKQPGGWQDRCGNYLNPAE